MTSNSLDNNNNYYSYSVDENLLAHNTIPEKLHCHGSLFWQVDKGLLVLQH